MNDTLRQRAELHLLRLVNDERNRRWRPEDPPWRRGGWSYRAPLEARHNARRNFSCSLKALIALGALLGQEAPTWLERFDSAEPREPSHPRPDTAPDPEIERQARKLLDERLPPAGLDKEDQAHSDEVSRFEEALIAIRISGALSAAEQKERSGRLDERLSAEDQKERHEPWRCKGVELLQVLPGPPLGRDGVTITHLELYADGLILHWHRAIPYPRPEGRKLSPQEHREAFRQSLPPPGVAAKLELEDDVGTSYRWMPGPSSTVADSKDALVYWVSATFTPRVPEEATRLFARHEASTFVIPLGA